MALNDQKAHNITEFKLEYQSKTCFLIRYRLYVHGKSEIQLLRLQNMTNLERKRVKIKNEHSFTCD